MPIYDYRCDHCGHTFSALQSFNDNALGTCPSCGAAPRRLIAAPGIVFKGSGWYKTDSRATPSSGEGAKSEPAATPAVAAAAKSDAASASSASTEAAPAAAAAAAPAKSDKSSGTTAT